MVYIMHAAGLFNQLANANFLAVALVCDVMLIRFFLCCSYVCLIIASSLGMPRWPGLSYTGGLALDALIWAVLCLIFHGHALTRLVLDERHIRFKTEDQEQLWRFFYRRGGMGRLEMKQALRYGKWVRVRAGDIIVHGPEARLRFFVLVEGQAKINSMYKGLLVEPRPLLSGSCFDMGLLSVFGVFNGMVKNDEHLFTAHAETNCLLYSWSIDELALMATQLAPAVGSYFRNFTLAQLGMFLGYRLYPNKELVCATGEMEPKGIMTGEVRSRDFTETLRPYEEQKSTVKGFMAWLKRSFNPFPPAGLRHTALPITGIMARNRLVAVKAAKAKAAIEAAEESSVWEDDVASNPSAHGGSIALEILERMQTLQQLDSTTVEALLQRAATQVNIRGLSGIPNMGSPGTSEPAKSREGSGSVSLASPRPSRQSWDSVVVGSSAPHASSARGLLSPLDPRSRSIMTLIDGRTGLERRNTGSTLPSMHPSQLMGLEGQQAPGGLETVVEVASALELPTMSMLGGVPTVDELRRQPPG